MNDPLNLEQTVKIKLFFALHEMSSCPEWIKFIAEDDFVQQMNIMTIYN